MEAEAVKKMLEAEAMKIYRFHYYLRQDFSFSQIFWEIEAILDFNKVEAEAEAAILEAEAG